jgi:hypothetical protein
MAEENKPVETSEVTEIFTKTVKSNPNLSLGLYVVNSICLAAGQALYEMTSDRWTSMSWFMRVAFWLLIIGNITNTWKAALSSSTRK